MNLSEIKKVLEKAGLKPKKSLGQNFLIDQNIVDKIIEIADINSKDLVLEIGPGLGGITEKLSQSAKRVIAVEKDQNLIKILKEELKEFKNLKIINEDFLNLKTKEVLTSIKNYKVVANLPYYITSKIIRKLLEEKVKPASITLTIQKEVAQRICARPPKSNLLSISVQFYGRPKIIRYIPKSCFWPKPKVDSAVLKISNIKEPKTNKDEFFKIVKAGFSRPRKQLAGNLSKFLGISAEEVKNILEKVNLNPQIRAEGLGVEDWQKLTLKLLRP